MSHHIVYPGGDDTWHVEADGKPLKSRCIFIRPHLAFSNKIESDHPPSHNTPGREKSTKKKKQPSSPAGPLSDRPASIGSPKDNKAAAAAASPQPFETLDDAVHFLLSRLNELQHIHMKSNNGEVCLPQCPSRFVRASFVIGSHRVSGSSVDLQKSADT